MLNLLRFREWADYSTLPELAPLERISGRAAYDRYVRHTLPFLIASGGSVDFFGTGGPVFVGPEDERWDLVMVIRQSSVHDFFAFASNQDYLAGVGHRTAALEDSRLGSNRRASPALTKGCGSRQRSQGLSDARPHLTLLAIAARPAAAARNAASLQTCREHRER